MTTLHCPIVTYEITGNESDKPGASYAWLQLTSLALPPFRIVTNAVPDGVPGLHLTSVSGGIICSRHDGQIPMRCGSTRVYLNTFSQTVNPKSCILNHSCIILIMLRSARPLHTRKPPGKHLVAGAACRSDEDLCPVVPWPRSVENRRPVLST